MVFPRARLGALEPETLKLLTRFTAGPDQKRIGLIDGLIRDLKTAGLWGKMDVFYVLAAHNEQAAQRNWKADLYNLTPANSPSFTADQGYTSDGATSYCGTGWDPATNGVNFTQDSASIGVWSRTAAQAGGSVIGTGTATSVNLSPRNGSDQFSYRLNQASSTSPANTDGSGWFVATRSGSAATEAFRNGVSLGTGSATSGALSSTDIDIGRGNSFFSTVQASAAMMGAHMPVADQLALYRALSKYMTAVGAA